MAQSNEDGSMEDETPNDTRPSRPDICNDDNNLGARDNLASPPPTVEETPRREENPFSFKRFLNQDNRGGGGVRRREFQADEAPVPILHTPEMSSVLPDFVQDHLVVEQCYLSSPSHHVPLPFDLPRPAEERPDPAVPMSLPDFLSDGPIHSQRCEGEAAGYQTSNDSHSNGHNSSPSWSHNDNDRLQREVDNLRRQLHERNRRVQVLESEVEILHSRDVRDTQSLEQALQQVENNLRQTTRRMVTAENTVLKLKADNKMLKARLDLVEGEASGGVGVASTSSACYIPNQRNQRLAQDLRGAASAAEVHLRALTLGIENLRQLASVVDDSHSFDEPEGAAGPAL